ncbi:hypothetical protein [Leucobacter sp. cx-169]|uniref:hypothetical protein n=1 Tax=Leucobacter sp. cx-169 TaxID=2770549 RepID=UPI00165E8668|nr:hypothetical protein [Leucobacter sp. cx-169]MBC9927169.1 hypothetical protein [Leucobacter sp. cx-169]
MSLSLIHSSVHEYRGQIQQRLTTGYKANGRGTASKKLGPQSWHERERVQLGGEVIDLLYFGGHGIEANPGTLELPKHSSMDGELKAASTLLLPDALPGDVNARLIYFDSCYQAGQLDALVAKFPSTLMFAQCSVSSFEGATNNARRLARAMELLFEEAGGFPDDPATLRAELGRVSGRGHDPLPTQNARKSFVFCGHWSAGSHRARPANGPLQPSRENCLRKTDWELPPS